MKGLLALSRAIDLVNEQVGRLIYWAILIMVLISAGNAVSRYALNIASNAWLELQWYLFALVFLLCSGYTLLHNEHVWIDVFGIVFFLLPMSLFIMWLSWPIFMNAWTSGEISGNSGGLIRWPARLLVPLGFFLLSAQRSEERRG